MIKETLIYQCHHCRSQNIIKNGHDAQGKQRYRCKECGKGGILPPMKVDADQNRSKIPSAARETNRRVVALGYLVGILLFIFGEQFAGPLWQIFNPLLIFLFGYYFQKRINWRTLNAIVLTLMLGAIPMGHATAAKVYEYTQVIWIYELGTDSLESDPTSLDSGSLDASLTGTPEPPVLDSPVANNIPSGTPQPSQMAIVIVPTDTPSATAGPPFVPTHIATATIPNPASTPTNSPLPTVAFSLTPPPTITATSSALPTDISASSETPIYTLTPTPILTPTPLDYEIAITVDKDCKGWEVYATTIPSGAEVEYNPAQSGKWNNKNSITVTVTARWPDGTIKVKEVQIRKVDDCVDITPTPISSITLTLTPAATSTPTPIWTSTPAITPTVVVTNSPLPTSTLTWVSTPTPTPTHRPKGEGCTPGYWINHLDAWLPTGYDPADDFDTLFAVDLFTPNITLKQALHLQGGKVERLARFGTTGLLNAAHPDIDYSLTVAEVIAVVQAGDNVDKIGEFDDLFCPLDK